MKTLFALTLLFLLVSAPGCDDEDCLCPSGPYFAELKVKLTINDENPELFLTVFEGNIESQDTLIAEWVSDSNVYYELEADRYYAATTTYQDGIREITAIDGRKMKTKEDDCGCAYGKNTSLNLRLAH